MKILKKVRIPDTITSEQKREALQLLVTEALNINGRLDYDPDGTILIVSDEPETNPEQKK